MAAWVVFRAPVDSLADVKAACWRVEVCPAQAQQFTRTASSVKRQREDHAETSLAGSPQKPLDLAHLHNLLFAPRQFVFLEVLAAGRNHAVHRIEADLAPLLREFEGHLEQRVDVIDRTA